MSGPGLIVRLLTPEGQSQISVEELPAALAGLADPSGPVTWIHTDIRPSVVLDDMGLNEIAVKSLGDGPERPRVEEFSDHLYVSLFSADNVAVRKKSSVGEPPPGRSRGEGAGSIGAATAAGLPSLRELRLFLGPRWIISLGHIHEADYHSLAGRMKRQVFSRDRGPSFVAYHLCEWLVESLQPAMERLDDRSVSNRLNKVMKQLTVVATMFMPLSFIVGLFGTNFTRMPFSSLILFVLMFLSVVAMVLFTWKRT